MTELYPITRLALPPRIKLEKNVYFTMRDGVKLAVDLYKPEKEGRYPVILSIMPYRKEAQLGSPMQGYHSEAVDPSVYVPKGYIMAEANTRGAGMSQGQYKFHDINEQRDGYDLVEAIAKQPWCDGNVGMVGGSYLGWSQYYTAAQCPPHLKCITPIDCSTDFYRDLVYQGGGMFNAGFVNNWGVNYMVADCLFPGPVEGKLPPMDFYVEWFNHYLDGPWWWERSMVNYLDKVKCPVLMIALGSAYLHCRGQYVGWTKIKSPKKLVVGPNNPKGMPSPYYWKNKRTNEYMLRWLNHWLKGIDTGIMKEPPVAIYDPGTDEWRYENEYPIARTKWTKYYLHSKPEQPGEPPQGLISTTAPSSDEEPHKYTAPRSSADLTVNKPVLAYVTERLEKDLKLQGPLSAVLFGSSATVDTTPLGWFVKVCDVAPDGTIALLTRGNLKACYRQIDVARSLPGQPYHPFTECVKVQPDKIYDYEIEIMPIFHTFKAGHRLWLQIASDDPAFVLNNPYDLVMGPVPSENSIYHDREHPSHLLLPVIPDVTPIAPVKTPMF
jgi:predicted acyl esterase